MKNLLISATILAASASTASIASANDDGFFNVNYNDIGFDLTQIGGYGELTIKPQGFGEMAFGSCVVNYTRDDSGAVKDMTPVVQLSSAKCPESVAFSIAPGSKGMYKIHFTDGGALKGKDFDLFPVLRPMSDEFKVTAPKGFDILGATIGMSRTDVEAILSNEGYSVQEGYNAETEYTDGRVGASAVWGKRPQSDLRGPEDSIGVTYTAVPKGEESSALVEAMQRQWNIPAEANLSVANLKKSLAEKHGAVTSQFDGRFYDRAGNLNPAAFQQVCADDVHLQSVTTKVNLPGSSEEMSVTPSCGASVDIMVLDSFETKGLATMLKLKLTKGDIAYSAFWESWSKTEEAELKKRYDMQSGMNSAAPKL